jgi:hypothetical protein
VELYLHYDTRFYGVHRDNLNLEGR